MKWSKFVVIMISILVISCTRINEISELSCNIGRIKLSKQENNLGYNIYISLKLKNNTNDTLFFPPNKSKKMIFPYSAFEGYINNEKIEFRELRRESKVLPKDSIRILLFSTYYIPKTNDSTFLCDIKKIIIKYTYQSSVNFISNKYIKKINIQRTLESKFEILDNNKFIEQIFLPGDEEFK